MAVRSSWFAVWDAARCLLTILQSEKPADLAALPDAFQRFEALGYSLKKSLTLRSPLPKDEEVLMPFLIHLLTHSDLALQVCLDQPFSVIPRPNFKRWCISLSKLVELSAPLAQRQLESN